MKNRTGFTLLELLVVVAIIGILVATVLPRFAGRTEQARKNRAEAEIYGSIATALDMYELDFGRYPESLSYLWSSEAPSGHDADNYRSNWNGPYIKRARIRDGSIVDPWSRPYKYKTVNSGASYELLSTGSGLQEPDDDIEYRGEVVFDSR